MGHAEVRPNIGQHLCIPLTHFCYLQPVDKVVMQSKPTADSGQQSKEESPLLGGGSIRKKYSFVGSSKTTQTLPTYSSEDDLPRREVDDSLLSVSIQFEGPLKEAPTKAKQREKKSGILDRVDQSAFQFALRMAILLTFSALFVLIRTDEFKFPDAMWVLVSVLFVSWFPALDAASVIEKIMQRLIGTFIGAFLGLSCGFLSLVITDTRSTQSIFLASCVFIFNFLIIFFAGQCKVGRVKVIKRFAYATILCVLTFCICIMPFSEDEDPKWGRAVYRVMNVVIGCAIGALGSIVIVPKSTTDVLYSKAALQVTMAGEAAEAVLRVSADFFAGRIEVNGLADELLNTPLESELRWNLISSSSLSSRGSMESGATDVALKKYEDAIADWRLSKMLFPLTKYDPFKIKFNNDDDVKGAFHTEIARTLARCLRIQTTIVVVDGMVRSDADYRFTAGQLESFAEIGKLIRQMLKLPLDREQSRKAARALFIKLEETRQAIQVASTAVSEIEATVDLHRSDGIKEFQRDLLCGDGYLDTIHSTRKYIGTDDMGRGIPVHTTGRDDNTLFFLQLVEHLILRSMRLYQAWQHVESIRKTQ